MSYALQYLTELYREFGIEFAGDERQAWAIIDGKKAEPQICVKSSAELMADLDRQLAGEASHTVEVDDCRPYIGNRFCQVVELGNHRGRITYEQAAVELGQRVKTMQRLKELTA